MGQHIRTCSVIFDENRKRKSIESRKRMIRLCQSRFDIY